MSFPPGTEMFQFPGFASYTYVFSARYSLRSGFPHSEIRGSTIARISPRLIAACHVLHRLLAPRHPPNALVLLHTSHHRPRAGPNRTQWTFTQPGRSAPLRTTRALYPISHTLDDVPATPSELSLQRRGGSSSTKSYSPFKRTCPTPRQSPGWETVEGSRHHLAAMSLSREPRQPGAPANHKPRRPTDQVRSHQTWRLTDSNR